MEKRSISHRNVCGAFVGGVLGILALGYLHPVGLPIGCLLGVIVGFWYDLIGNKIAEEYLRFRVKLYRCQRMVDKMLRFRPKLFVTLPRIQAMGFARRIFLVISQKLVFAFWWLSRSPAIFSRWFRRHPANQMITLEIFTLVFLAALNAIWIPKVIIFSGRAASHATKGSSGELWGIVCIGTVLLIIFTIVMQVTALAVRYNDKLRLAYAHYEKYSQCGKLRYFLIALWELFRIELFVFFVLLCCLSGFALLIPAVLFCLVLAIGVGLFRGLASAAMSKGYGTCFVSTLLITGITGGLLYSLLTSHLLIWLVALGTGTFCGLAVEPIRQVVGRWCANSDFVFSAFQGEFDDVVIRVATRLGLPVFKKVEIVAERIYVPA